MKNVVVVGGPHAFVSGQFRRHLEGVGLTVVGHYTNFEGEKVRFTELPMACDGVIVINSMTSHKIMLKVKAAAESRHLPFIGVPHKWSLAESVLRRFNFIH